ncbi:MAG: site-2 protease family protein [Gemmatimonadales bacterium]
MDQLTGLFTAWKVVQAGSREITDAVVAPEHRGPSAALLQALSAWDGAYYWPERDSTHLVLVRRVGPQQPERYWLHLGLLLLTALCALGAGAALGPGRVPAEGPGVMGAVGAGLRFFLDLGQGSWHRILNGWTFAVPLLGILLIHELGHYFAARRYAIDASLPYFLPVPPSLSPIGSLGAFIRLRSPVLDRLQLLDVGAAGPLAGFLVAVAVLGWGYLTSQRVLDVAGLPSSFVVFAGRPIGLGDSYLTHLLRDYLLPGAGTVHLSPPAFAGWVGVFITGLNLLPLSQLDGGHVLYGLLGRRQAAVGFVALLGLIYLAQYSPSWYLWVLLALLVGGGGWSHPSVLNPRRSIPSGRRVLGWLCVAVFVATFVPVPFR